MRIIGSQCRETLQEAGYTLVARLPYGEIVLEDNSGQRELWAENDHFAGYVVEVNGKGHEFVREYKG